MKRFRNMLTVAVALSFVSQYPVQGYAPAVSLTNDAWITLGTGGGPFIRRERSEPANALVVNNAIYLFDVGSGTERQLVGAKLQLRNVKAIFISHHHIDHNADLGQLMNSRWLFNSYSPLPIVGPLGTKKMVADLAASAGPVELAPIGNNGRTNLKPAIASTVDARDMALSAESPVEVFRDENIRVLAVTNAHYHFATGSDAAEFARSYSFRIQTPTRSIVYTGDTGPSRNVELLARGADLLVSEVIDLDKMMATLNRSGQLPEGNRESMEAHMKDDHLTPLEVGRLAAIADVKAVVLTHLAPAMDGETDVASYARGIDKLYKGPVKIANDLDRF